MMLPKEIYRWRLPEDHHDCTGHDDLPEAYTIEENHKATCGIVIFGKYRGEWIVNPWNIRTLVKHLFDKANKAEAELADTRNHNKRLETEIAELKAEREGWRRLVGL